MASNFGVVTVDVPIVEDCPVLTRLKAYVVPQGVVPTIEHVFRDHLGNPLDFSALCTHQVVPYPGAIFAPDSQNSNSSESSQSSQGSESSQSASEALNCTVHLAMREAVSPACSHNKLFKFDGVVVDASKGIVRFPLSAKATQNAGIFQMSVGIKDSTEAFRHIESPFLWIERSLFTLDRSDKQHIQGPPSLQDVRQAIIDNAPAENLLLDDVEFTADQILHAVCRPVRLWNELPPPLNMPLDTRVFPFHEAWLQGIMAQLFLAAAHHYRRNTLPYQAGGITVDDKNKEKEYAAAGTALWATFKDFVLAKRYELNQQLFRSNMGSPYSHLG